jgi:hypothetical protein
MTMLGSEQAVRQSRAFPTETSPLPLNEMRVVTIRQLDQQQSVTFAPSGREARHLGLIGSSSYVRALARLRYLGRYVDGWDGPGTRAAIRKSFAYAVDFLGLVPQLGSAFRVEAMIFAPGTAALSIVSDDVDARLEFLPEGTIAANIDSAQAQIDADIYGFSGTTIPAQLAALLVPSRQQEAA